MESFHEVIKAGGIILFVLSGISVYSIAVILERFFAFRKISAYYAGLRKKMVRAIRNNDVSPVRDYCKENESATSAMMLALIRSKADKSEKREFAGRASDKYINDISSRISILATIGSISPFIGLFGTVLGVMRAFRDLSITAGAGPSVVALGISEALVNTAAGLFVAVPAVFFYNMFANKANGFAADLNWFAEQIIAFPADSARQSEAQDSFTE